MPLRRREVLQRAATWGLTASAADVLSACAQAPVADHPWPKSGEVLDAATGARVEREAWVALMRSSSYVLLGEQHDDREHHAVRGAWLRTLQGRGATVVTEHLPEGAQVAWGGDVLASLRGAGFDAESWDWPVHDALYADVQAAGLPLSGGDVSEDVLRRVGREGAAALPPALAMALRAAPLSGDARTALEADLVQSHGGRLQVSQLAAMLAAQRARDASLWVALKRSGGEPAVLLAGNGHVRRDHGVPVLIAAAEPGARVLSVGFLSAGDTLANNRGLYSHVWLPNARLERRPS